MRRSHPGCRTLDTLEIGVIMNNPRSPSILPWLLFRVIRVALCTAASIGLANSARGGSSSKGKE